MSRTGGMISPCRSPGWATATLDASKAESGASPTQPWHDHHEWTRARAVAAAMSLALTILGLLAVAGASACRRAPEFDFRCPGGPVVAARYTGDSVALRLPEGIATLPRALSASGA